MSAHEIIAELPKLKPEELQEVKARVEELSRERAAQLPKTLSESLLEFAGVAEGLPSDLAENHDHYLHGVPKRRP